MFYETKYQFEQRGLAIHDQRTRFFNNRDLVWYIVVYSPTTERFSVDHSNYPVMLNFTLISYIVSELFGWILHLWRYMKQNFTSIEVKYTVRFVFLRKNWRLFHGIIRVWFLGKLFSEWVVFNPLTPEGFQK